MISRHHSSVAAPALPGPSRRVATAALLAILFWTSAATVQVSAEESATTGSLTVPPQVLRFDADTGYEWVARWGVVPPDDPRLLRLRDVFERLAGQIDIRGTRVPRLVTVGKVGHLDARALVDGSVVISQEWLDFAYRGVGRERLGEPTTLRGDHLVAFILGHELAHLSRDDDGWLQTVHAASVAGDASRPESPRMLDQDLRSREQVADRQAVFAMLIGGFDPDHVLRPNLFERVESENRRFGVQMAYDVHLPPEPRAAALEAHLADVAARVPVYEWGVRLLELGRYEDGVRMLEAFQNVFDGPSALASLGYGHYQIAARELAECDGRLVVDRMMPTLIDGATVADRTRLRGGGMSSCLERSAFRDAIERSQLMLEAAVKRAPYAVAPRLNLIAALDLDRDRASFAFPHAERLLEIAPELPEARVAFAMVQHRIAQEWGMADASEAALGVIDEVLATSEHAPPAALYNRGSILESLGRVASARRAYEEFLELQSDTPWADHAREVLGRADVASSGRPARGSSQRPSRSRGSGLECGLPVGMPDEETRERLAAMNRIDLAWHTTPVELHEGDGLQVLVIDGIVEVVERRLDRPGSDLDDFDGVVVPLAGGRMRRGSSRALRADPDGSTSLLCYAPAMGDRSARDL